MSARSYTHFLLLFLMSWLPLAAHEAALSAQTVQGSWLAVDIAVIGPASEDILQSALDEAIQTRHAGVIIRLDTPGGSLESTRGMVKAILGSPLPIVVWVGPAGSRAGSAGAFITLAGHIAAMAPGTNIGAAHPVAVGEDIDKSSPSGQKVTNDTLAFIESIAIKRGRDVAMARSFVSDSVSITDAEALQKNIIDLVAADIPTLLTALDGRSISLDSGEIVQLSTQGASSVDYQKSFRQMLLEILSNPNIFYLLFMAGLIGLAYELTHPGLLFPGVVGGICMILALIATSVLPISFGAAALILVGVALLVAEAFVPSFGILGIGGLVAFVLGSVFLVDPGNEQGLRLSWLTIAPVAVTVGSAFLLLGFLVMRAERAKPLSGKEAMIGQQGVALTDFDLKGGQIRVAGAIWNAVPSTDEAPSIRRGDTVQVLAIKGLQLTVSKV